MTRRLGARLERLEQAAPKAPEGTQCVHHGPACGLGTIELPEIYRLAVEARRRLGMPAPPLDEHRAATPAEAAQYRREYEAALSAAKERNTAAEAELEAGAPWT